MKILVLCALCVAMALAEPPVDNRYLPPQQDYSTSFPAPSQTFGAPGPRKHTDAVFRGRPSTSYGTPSFTSRTNLRRPSPKYGPPQFSSQFRTTSPLSSSQYNAPSAQSSSRYLPPSQPSSQYGPPQQARMNRLQGSTGFGGQARSRQFGSPRTEYAAPSQQYGAPGFAGVGGDNSLGADGAEAYVALEQSRRYLPPGRQGFNDHDDENGEPASYNFEYMVQDEESGNDFGHRESREGDRAEGLYYVLLPDGRKQTVEYEADQEGYRPKISYEDTGAASGEYNRNGYQNGYQSESGPY